MGLPAGRPFLFPNNEKGWKLSRLPPFKNTGSRMIPKQSEHMIFHIQLNLKKLFIDGKNFPWPRPACKCGNPKPWGHGYVPAYFDGFSDPFWLKRYRCPDCGKVIKLKPKGYFNKFQASIDTIRFSVIEKCYSGKWLPGILHSRQNHWFQALIRKTKAFFGNLQSDLVAAFEKLKNKREVPVSRSI